MRFRFELMLVAILFSIGLPTFAQQTLSLNCGDIIEDEFISDSQQHDYSISLNAGDSVQIIGTPIGQTLQFGLALFNSTAQLVTAYENGAISNNPNITSPILSSNGIYTFTVSNTNMQVSTSLATPVQQSGGLGVYILYIGCHLRDGTVIQPGDSLATVEPPTTDITNSIALQSEFSGFGFPGLAPVDMSDVARIPITAGIPFTGAITPAGSEILGYTVSATTDQRINLNVERLSGNLNLGVVVIDADSNIIYFSALVTSEAMSTRIRIPADGEYMVSAFRLDLLSPDVPEATAFSVQVDIVE